MIDMLKRIGEWIVDYIVEIRIFGSLITVIVLLIFAIYFSSNNTSSHYSTTLIPVYNGRITTLIPITRCY
jgi:hypothetical protein